MLRRRVRYPLLVVLMALLMGISFGSGSLLPVALGENNPTDQVVPVSYLDSQGQGPPHNLDLTFHNVAYNPEFTGWCAANHRTAAGNKFYHAHTWDKFPFQDTTRYPYVWVTAEMCDWYWDMDYNVQPPDNVGWDKKQGETATTVYNCHGYAFRGGSFWITDSGRAKIIEDEYTSVGLYQSIDGCVASWGGGDGHSYKVLAVSEMWPKPPWPWDLERHIEEKSGSSAIYQFIDLPGYGLTKGWGYHYRKNN